MEIEEAINYINNIPPFVYPLGNQQLKVLLKKLGNPQNELKFIHIVGTNGKGSASAMISQILIEAGYTVGTFTSPYLIKPNERIKLNNIDISDFDFSRTIQEVADVCDREDIHVSQFAYLLAVALKYYSENKCEYVVLEAGMGGRLDATNVIENVLATVIMSISLDHTAYLGDTVEKIAREKADVIRKNGIVAAYRNNSSADDVIIKESELKNAKLLFGDEAIKTNSGFICNGVEYSLGLSGDYQAKNASVVLTLFNEIKSKLKIKDEVIKRGFENTKWRARFEKVRENVIVDGGHNPDGIKAMVQSVSKFRQKKTAIVAMMQDKAVCDSLIELKKGFDNVIVTELKMPRCMKADELAEIATELGFSADVCADCERAFETTKTNEDLYVVCGSIYLAGEAIKYFG